MNAARRAAILTTGVLLALALQAGPVSGTVGPSTGAPRQELPRTGPGRVLGETVSGVLLVLLGAALVGAVARRKDEQGPSADRRSLPTSLPGPGTARTQY